MRAILLVAALLLGVGLVAGELPSDATRADSAPEAARWVRTRDGWERTSDWAPPAVPHEPNLHPLSVAAGQLLFSLLGLALSRD